MAYVGVGLFYKYSFVWKQIMGMDCREVCIPLVSFGWATQGVSVQQIEDQVTNAIANVVKEAIEKYENPRQTG